MKETIFFSCLTAIIIFESFYLVGNPSLTWSIGIGAFTGFFISGIGLVILSSVNALTISLGDIATRVIFITSVGVNLMFQLPIGFTLAGHSYNIPIGIGLLYPTCWNLFTVRNSGFLGLMGLVLMSVISLLVIVCLLLMAGGTYD